ncbi:MAG: PilZ domain-containing protein [Azospirillaceae bacterium]
MGSLARKDVRRRFHRIDWPRFAGALNGVSGRTRDWSWGGFAFDCDGSEPLTLERDDVVTGCLSLSPKREPCRITGRIVRVDPEERVVAVAFESLNEELLELFERALRESVPRTR